MRQAVRQRKWKRAVTLVVAAVALLLLAASPVAAAAAVVQPRELGDQPQPFAFDLHGLLIETAPGAPAVLDVENPGEPRRRRGRAVCPGHFHFEHALHEGDLVLPPRGHFWRGRTAGTRRRTADAPRALRARGPPVSLATDSSTTPLAAPDLTLLKNVLPNRTHSLASLKADLHPTRPGVIRPSPAVVFEGGRDEAP